MGKRLRNLVSWLRRKVFKKRSGKKSQKKQESCTPSTPPSMDSKMAECGSNSGPNLDEVMKTVPKKYSSVRLPPIEQEYEKAKVKVAKLPPISISTTRTGNLAFEVNLQGPRPVTARGRRPFYGRNSSLTSAKPLQLLDQINAKAALVSANRERHLQALKERLQKSEENAQRIRERKNQFLLEVLDNEVEEEGTESSSDTAASSIPAVSRSANAKKLSSDFAAQPKEKMDEIEAGIDSSASAVLPSQKTMYSSTDEPGSTNLDDEMVKKRSIVFNSKVELITEEEDEDDENKLVVKRSQLDIKDEKDVKRRYGRHRSRAFCRPFMENEFLDEEEDDDDDNDDCSTGCFIDEESIDSFLEEMEEKELSCPASEENPRPGNPMARKRYFVYENDRTLDPQYEMAGTYTSMADDRLNYALGRMWKSELKDPDDCTVLEPPVVKKYYDAELSDEESVEGSFAVLETPVVKKCYDAELSDEESVRNKTTSNEEGCVSPETCSTASLEAETDRVPYKRRYLPERRSNILNDCPPLPILPVYQSLPPLALLKEFSNRHNTSVHVADKLQGEALKEEKRRTLTTLRRCGIVREDPLLTRPITSRPVCLTQEEEADWNDFEKEAYLAYSPVLSSNSSSSSSLSSRPTQACKSRKLLDRRVYRIPNMLPKIAEEETPTLSLPKIRNAPITSQQQGVKENSNQNKTKSHSDKYHCDMNGRLHIWTKYLHR